MPTYVYETTDSKPTKRLEIRQGMTEKALTHDPDSGRPVKRVITGGIGIITESRTGGSEAPSSCCSGGACGCG